MTWTVSHPFLFFLPLFLCLAIHIFLSAGFLLATKQGVFRLLVYLLSCWFVVVYLLIFNHGVVLAGTKISLDFANRYLHYENPYGTVRIAAEEVQAVVVEGPETSPQTIWIQSQRQTFYLDRHFGRWDEFLPLLQSFVELGEPQPAGKLTVYRASAYTGQVDLNLNNNILQGNMRYFLLWLVLFPFLAYPLAARGWLGEYRYFYWLAAGYGVPLLVLALFFPPTLLQAAALVLYPCHPVFLSAMCLPDNYREN